MKKTPIIIDCDPGVDDSFAIALANAAETIEIKAITAVEGNVPADLTRRNALFLAEVLKIDCRVGYGAELPLKKAYDIHAEEVHGSGGLGEIEVKELHRHADAKPAWDIIYEEAVKAQGELVLIATGPLTNIALTLRKYPDLPQHLKRFVIMGGGTFGNVSASKNSAEFNIWIDPSAAKEVFEQLDVYMVGLNVTHPSAISDRDFEELIAICKESEQNWLLYELAKFSNVSSAVNGPDRHIIHDAVAVAAVVDPRVVTFEPYYVEVVDDEKAVNDGETWVDLKHETGKPANCHVGMHVDSPLFLSMMKEMCRYYNR